MTEYNCTKHKKFTEKMSILINRLVYNGPFSLKLIQFIQMVFSIFEMFIVFLQVRPLLRKKKQRLFLK